MFTATAEPARRVPSRRPPGCWVAGLLGCWVARFRGSTALLDCLATQQPSNRAAGRVPGGTHIALPPTVRASRDHRCSYVVFVERTSTSEVRDLAQYLSILGTFGCQV